MLLKYSQYQKRSKLGAPSKPQRGFATGSKKIAASKGHRKGKVVGNKKVNGQRILGSRIAREDGPQTVPDACDNSNDSGLGFDHQDSYHHHHQIQQQQNTFTSWGNSGGEQLGSSGTPRPTVAGVKRRLLDIKIESDDANDNFSFPHLHQQHLIHHSTPQPVTLDQKITSPPVNRRIESGGKNRNVGKKVNAASAQSSVARSRNGRTILEIVSQPETQHRARYQTEGSRGAVKDTSGNSFPLVKLSGYDGGETAILQVYIGTDQGKVAPHMFYQACKVSGKNSTPCVEKKINGTVVIEIEFNPSKDMLVLCDCVGILKERNVDVEHRFPEENQTKSRKKSTRCRMVFRTTVTLQDGTVETLQVTSHPIVCTQPPGVPEICKKSLTSCPVGGGVELFIIGKNFLKDTQVRFSEGEPGTPDYWDRLVMPDKEYLHQSHLVCTVPRYRQEDTKVPVAVSVSIVSGGKASETVPFVFTPNGTVPCHSLRPASSYAVPQNLAQESTSLMPTLPDVAFPGQKILLVPSGMEMNNQNVVNCLTNKIKVLKEEEEWLKTEVVDQPSILGPSSGLPQGNTMGGGMVMPMGPISLSPPMVGPARSLSLSPGRSSAETSPTPMVLHSPPVMAAPMVESPATSPPGSSPPLLQAMALTLPEQTPPLQPAPIVETNTMLTESPTSLIPSQNIVESQPIIEQSAILPDVSSPLVSILTSTASMVEPRSLMEPPPNPTVIEGSAGGNLIEPTPTSSNSSVMKLDPSMATIEKFVSSTVSSTPLPALNVERYLSHIESKDQITEGVKVKYETSPAGAGHYGGNKQVIESFQPPKEVMESFATPKRVMEPFSGGAGDSFFASSEPKPPAPAPQQLPAQPPPMPSVPHELTVMSETDLISYINPSCFDQGIHSFYQY